MTKGREIQTAFGVAKSGHPVFRDGLTSTLTYAILAVKPANEYNCICMSDYRTLKFYPNYEFWGVTPELLTRFGLKAQYDRADYQGVHGAPFDAVADLLEYLRGQDKTVVAVTGKIERAFNDDRPRQESRRFHPATNRVPSPLGLAGPHKHLLIEA